MNRKPSSKKIFKVIIALLLLLFIGSVFIKRKPSQYQDIKRDNVNWRIPNLPEGFNWVENDANQQDIENNKILFNDRYEKSSEENVVTGHILAPGKIYTVKLTDKDWNYKDAGYTTENLLRKSLEGTGWSSSTRVGNHVVYGIASSGVKSSVTGYVRVEDNKVRTVVFSYFYEGDWITPENEPAFLKCPCSVSMTIFISEPVELSEYIPLN